MNNIQLISRFLERLNICNVKIPQEKIAASIAKVDSITPAILALVGVQSDVKVKNRLNNMLERLPQT